MKTYKEKLLDPRWQKKRLKVLDRDEFRCQLCWNNKETLHIHHKYYERGKSPWQYPIKALITICKICHEKISHKKTYGTEEKNNKPKKFSDEKTEEAQARFFKSIRKTLDNAKPGE